MVKGLSTGLMEVDTKDNTKMVEDMVKELSFGVMEEDSKDSSSTEEAMIEFIAKNGNS